MHHNVPGPCHKHVVFMGACGLVDRVLNSKSQGLGFDFQCWPHVGVSGKPCIPQCLGPPSCNGYLVHRSKVGSIVAGCIGAHLARGKVKSVEHALSWSLDNHLYLFFTFVLIVHNVLSSTDNEFFLVVSRIICS